MVSLSVAWVVVTIVKQKNVSLLKFNPVVFFITGLIDLAIVSAIFGVF